MYYKGKDYETGAIFDDLFNDYGDIEVQFDMLDIVNDENYGVFITLVNTVTTRKIEGLVAMIYDSDEFESFVENFDADKYYTDYIKNEQNESL